MNNQSNRFLMATLDDPPPQGAFPVWSKVFTRPGERTFVEITRHPEATAKAAYIWVFVAGTFSTLITSVLQSVILRQVSPGLVQMPELPGGAIGVFSASIGLISVICISAVSGIFSVIGFAIGVAIVQATAKFFGGPGSFDKLAYAFGAIAAPVSLIVTLIVPLSLIPSVRFYILALLLPLILYMLFLQVTAIKAVHRFGWGGAMASLFLPNILIVLSCGLLFLGLISLVPPAT